MSSTVLGSAEVTVSKKDTLSASTSLREEKSEVLEQGKQWEKHQTWSTDPEGGTEGSQAEALALGGSLKRDPRSSGGR